MAGKIKTIRILVIEDNRILRDGIIAILNKQPGMHVVATISEVNNYGFYVERRSEGSVNFTELPNSFIPGNGTTLEPHTYSFTDSTAKSGIWYYRLRQVDLDGIVNYSQEVKINIILGVKEEIPRVFALHQNYPNPFNPTTTINYQLPVKSIVIIRIYNLLGQNVKTIVDEIQNPGYKSVEWNSTNNFGNNVSSGVYIFRLVATSAADSRITFTDVMKMLFAK